MVTNIKSSYEIRCLSPNDKDYSLALKIYFTNTAECIRTDTNELTSWSVEYLECFPDRRLYQLGFYYEKTLVGFSQLVYFGKFRLLFIDYMAIDAKYRKNGTFFAFVDHIERFIYEEGLEFNYVLTEVGHLHNDDNEPASESKYLLRLLKLVGFSVIKAPYRQPSLGLQNLESLMKAQLLIFAPSKPKMIKRETYLEFVRVIFFEHYYKWYEKFLDKRQLADYEKQLNSLFSEIRGSLKGDSVQINGYHVSEGNFSIGVNQPPSNSNIPFKVILELSALLLVISFFFFGIMKLFGFTLAVILPVYFMVLFFLFAAVSLFIPKASKILDKIGGLLKYFSRNIK